METRKTGTTTIGIVTKDAVIVAADKRATAGNLIAMKDVTKVLPISETMVVTITGVVSDIQLLVKYIKAEIKLKDLKTGMKTSVRAVANLIASFNYSGLRAQGSIAGFLLAGHDHGGAHLYDITIDGVVTEITDYESTGSGSVFVLGVLEANYKKNLSEEQGLALIKQAITAAIERDSASGNGYDIVVVTKNAVRHHETVRLKSVAQ